MTTPSRTPLRPTAVKAVLLATSFVAMLNETSVNVALSALMGVFGVSVTTVQWLVTGFMLVMAVVVPTTAYLQARFATRPLYFTSVALLALGGLLAGLAPAFGFLLAGRLVQSVGTCVLMSLTVTTVMRLTPPQDRGAAMGLVGLVTLFAPAVAPTVGGLLLQLFGWNWIFLGALPLLAVLALTAAKFLENVAETRPLRLDLLSVVLAALGFGGLLFGLSSLDRAAAQPLEVGGALVVGAVGLGVFTVRQKARTQPLVDLAVFGYRQFTLAMIFVVFCILSVFGLTMLTPLALGQLWGLAAAAAGLAMLPGGLLNGVTAPLFGKLYDRFGPRGLALGGTAAMLAALVGLALLPPGTPVGLYIGGHVLFLLGVSAAMTVNQANGMNALPPRLIPHGTAVMSTLMQLAGGIGTAVYISVLAAFRGGQPADGFHAAFGLGALLLLVPLAAAFFLKKSVHPES